MAAANRATDRPVTHAVSAHGADALVSGKVPLAELDRPSGPAPTRQVAALLRGEPSPWRGSDAERVDDLTERASPVAGRDHGGGMSRLDMQRPATVSVPMVGSWALPRMPLPSRLGLQP